MNKLDAQHAPIQGTIKHGWVVGPEESSRSGKRALNPAGPYLFMVHPLA
jgi:hypothetical protein